MSSASYGLNFGFRRSDESMAIREGRYRTPALTTGGLNNDGRLLQGSAVEIDPDPANDGYLKQSAAGAVAVTGLRGVLVQEEDHIGDVFTAAPLLGHDSIDLGFCFTDTLSAMWSGPGIKYWFKNSPVYARGRRHRPAVNIVDITKGGGNIVPGDSLGWDGDHWAYADGTTIHAWLTVTKVVPGSDHTTDYVEAVSVF
jgi:hypothetical protein